MVKPRVTIKEVAASAGVSYQTVSKVINHQVRVSNETETRIWEAVRRLGYKPSYTARSLRSQRAYAIGYSWPTSPFDQPNTILDYFLQSMLVAAERHGYYLLCFPYHNDPKKHLEAYTELIDTGRVDGFVLSSIEYNDPRVLMLLERNMPFVAFGRSNPELNFSWIDIDGSKGVFQAVNHLLEQGHRNIAVLAWPEDSRVGNNRISGYFNALQHAGIEINPAWIQRGEGSFKFGIAATRRLLQLPVKIRPTAVICMNDMMAVGAIQAARDGGLVIGKEFAVGGFDDYPLVKYIDPPLTTIRQPIIEVGQQIITMLLSMIHSKEPLHHQNIMLDPELVVRASTLRG